MKRIPFLYILILVSLRLSAQILPIGQPGQEWSHVEIHCLPQGNSYSSVKLVAGSDTVLSGVVYQTIWNSTVTPAVYHGALRNEEESGKTWYRYPFTETEGLLYDFSLQSGDTARLVNQLFGSDTISLRVIGRDSVQIGGTWRRRITLTNYALSLQEWWIEGIGSQWGVLNAGNSYYSASCGGQELLCYWENGQQLYQNSAFAVCDFGLPSALPEPENHPAHLWPNPASQRLFIAPTKKGNTLDLINSSGIIVHRVTTTDYQTEVPVERFAPGLYFVRLTGPKPQTLLLQVVSQ